MESPKINSSQKKHKPPKYIGKCQAQQEKNSNWNSKEMFGHVDHKEALILLVGK